MGPFLSRSSGGFHCTAMEVSDGVLTITLVGGPVGAEGRECDEMLKQTGTEIQLYKILFKPILGSVVSSLLGTGP